MQNWKERTTVEKESRMQVTIWRATKNWNSQRRLVVIVNWKT